MDWVKSLLTGFLPKDRGTYLAIGICLLAIWGFYGATAAGLIGEGAAAPLAIKACLAGTEQLTDVDAKTAAIDVCNRIDDKPISLTVALALTGFLLVAAFLRRSIGGLSDLLKARTSDGSAPRPPPV